jgi:hypothetical protein
LSTECGAKIIRGAAVLGIELLVALADGKAAGAARDHAAGDGVARTA